MKPKRGIKPRRHRIFRINKNPRASHRLCRAACPRDRIRQQQLSQALTMQIRTNGKATEARDRNLSWILISHPRWQLIYQYEPSRQCIKAENSGIDTNNFVARHRDKGSRNSLRLMLQRRLREPTIQRLRAAVKYASRVVPSQGFQLNH